MLAQSHSAMLGEPAKHDRVKGVWALDIGKVPRVRDLFVAGTAHVFPDAKQKSCRFIAAEPRGSCKRVLSERSMRDTLVIGLIAAPEVQ